LLRDVFEYSVKETAVALGLTEANIKTTHHRARRALEPYEQSRCRPSPELVARSTEALQRFLTSLMTDDVAAVEAQLAEGVVALNDGGGEFFAARRPVVGASRVARLNLGIKKMGPPVTRWEIRILNGLPALVAERDGVSAKDAPRFVLRIDIDADGRVAALHTILATRKLTALRPIGSSTAA
jgi:RNA polymerase sigma-70 factor, ECF subfamily